MPNTQLRDTIPEDRLAYHDAPPTALVINGRSRRGRESFQAAQRTLRALGVRLTETRLLDDPTKLVGTLRAVIATGARQVIVGGGDGSFRTAAEILVDTDVVLGLLPLGTVNDLARNLRVGDTVEQACATIACGRTERIDVGRANDRLFLLTASLGFSAQTQACLTERRKRWYGSFGYVVASLLALRRMRDLRVSIFSAETDETIEAMQAGVVNSHHWMAGRVEIPGVDLVSGRLAFYAVAPQRRAAYARMVYNLIRGRFFQTTGLRAFTTTDVTIETEYPQPIVLDGDLCGETPVRLRLRHKALRVRVPETFGAVC